MDKAPLSDRPAANWQPADGPEPAKPRLVPLPAAIACWVLFVLVLGGIGALAWHWKHTPRLLSVPQAQIDSVSTLSRTLGSPVSSLPDDHTLHLIIYYDGYKDQAVAQHYVGLVQATLRETEPWKSATNLQVTVFTSPVSQCSVYKSAKNILECKPSLLKQVNALGYQHFKLFVMSPDDFAPSATVARGKNSAFYVPTYQGTLTQKEIDTFVSLYFLHEMGHSLGLRDEYARQRYGSTAAAADVASGNSAYAAAQPNCAPNEATAQAWWGAYVTAGLAGYYPGCAGNASWFYPVQNTVMSGDPTDATYGQVSEDYLRGALQCFYGDATAITFPATEKVPSGVTGSCAAFEAQYPGFWTN